MKKLLLFLVLSLIPSAALAGGVIHNSNVSPEYIRTFTRNAASDSADAAHYNPAGLVWMQDGFYLNLGNQFVSKMYSHSYNDGTTTTTWKDEKPVLLYPNIFAVYKHNNWAIFGSMVIPGGGGSLDYKSGVFYNGPVEVKSAQGFTAHIATTLGGSFSINKIFSVALGGRFIYGTGNVESRGDITLFGLNDVILKKYDTTTKGFGGVVSANARPIKGLNIALRFETGISLKWEVENSPDVSDNLKVADRQEDLPPVLAFGVSYKINPLMRAELNFNYYMNKLAKWEKQDDTILNDDAEFQKRFDNGWEVAGSFEYRVMKGLKLSIGGMYTVSGADKHSYDYMRPPLDVFSLGLGACYSPIKNLKFNIGFSNSWYFDDKVVSDQAVAGNEHITLELSKSTRVLALGVQYKF